MESQEHTYVYPAWDLPMLYQCVPGLGFAYVVSVLLSVNHQTSGILRPDPTGIYIETLLQNYKAELCNKKITYLGLLPHPNLRILI